MRNVTRAGTLIAIAACTSLGLAQETQPNPVHHKVVAQEGIDSGILAFSTGDTEEVLYSAMADSAGAMWMRLVFGEADLGHAFLRLTSLHDGHQQRLDRVSVEQWQHMTAVFNGDAVFVELVAPPHTSGQARIQVTDAWAGEPSFVGESICDSVDDRQLSQDPRQGRVWSIGCTAWLIDDCQRCMLTAGHCGPSSTSVIQFNVPLSSSGGSPIAPPPDDQYAVDPASIQGNGGQGVGNDYSYFGVFPNSNTGLHPADAQGATYVLAPPALPSAGETIRITGYGSTSSPVSPTWYLVQKTHSGPEQASTGTTVSYRTDTTGGNSGSPIIQEGTGFALGIHTHGGCSTNGAGQNYGTSLLHPGLQSVLAVGTGVCECRAPTITLLNTVPDFIAPGGGYELEFEVTASDAAVDPDTVELLVDTGSGFASIDATPAGGDQYTATVPAGDDCGDEVVFYLSAADVDGKVATLPANAAAPWRAVTADGLDIAHEDGFETDTGWTVSAGASGAPDTGAWERATPQGTDAQSNGAHTGSFAWVTGAAAGTSVGANDIDNGTTVLTSPAFDLTSTPQATISYWRWFNNSAGSRPNEDALVIEISDDDGSTWETLEVVGPAGDGTSGGWIFAEHALPDTVDATSTVRLRFTAEDLPGLGSIVEAAIDDLQIGSLICDGGCAADLTGEGDVNTNDFFMFLSLYQAQDPRADFEPGNGINTNDFFAFLAAYQAGC